MKKILCLQAHPNDALAGCGGTLLRHKEDGDEILIFTFTKGERAVPPDLYPDECDRKWARPRELDKILDQHGFPTWDKKWQPEEDYPFQGWETEKEDYPFCDGEVPAITSGLPYLDPRIQKYNPDVVYIPYPRDTHPDHVNTAQLALTLTRRFSCVLFYESFFSIAFDPSIFVDIRCVLEKKRELLRALKIYKVDVPAVEAIARFRGVQSRIKFAEGFAPVRYVLRLEAA